MTSNFDLSSWLANLTKIGWRRTTKTNIYIKGHKVIDSSHRHTRAADRLHYTATKWSVKRNKWLIKRFTLPVWCAGIQFAVKSMTATQWKCVVLCWSTRRLVCSLSRGRSDLPLCDAFISRLSVHCKHEHRGGSGFYPSLTGWWRNGLCRPPRADVRVASCDYPSMCLCVERYSVKLYNWAETNTYQQYLVMITQRNNNN